MASNPVAVLGLCKDIDNSRRLNTMKRGEKMETKGSLTGHRKDALILKSLLGVGKTDKQQKKEKDVLAKTAMA